MANISGASLTPILRQLNTTDSYHPLEAETFADWSVEAGDVVTVSRDGNDYKSPVHSSKISWKKGQEVSLSSTGKEERDSISKMSQKKYTSGSGGSSLRDTLYQHIYVEDVYNQLKSGLELTTSSATLYVQDAYRQLSSGLALTSSSAALYVNDNMLKLSSELKVTSSSITAYVKNENTRLNSKIEQTANKIKLVVNDDRTLNTAEIVASINRQGGSFVKIKADKIDLVGYVTAGELKATNAAINNITSGNTNISKLWVNTINGYNETLTGWLTYLGHQIVSLNAYNRNGDNIAVLGWRQ